MSTPEVRLSNGKVIHKFPLHPGGWGLTASAKHNVEMPLVSVVLALQLQNGVPTLWAMVDPKTPAVTKTFQWVGTGNEVPFGGEYVGTIQMQGGSFVFHLFELDGA